MFEACQSLQRSDTPITDDTTIISFRQPGSIIDPLTEIARDGARRVLMAAKAEADNLVVQFSEELLADGRQRLESWFGKSEQVG